MATSTFTWTISDVSVDATGWFVVATQDIDTDGSGTPQPHVIMFRPEAIGDRMAFYGLDTERAGFDAILRENAQRLISPPAPGQTISKDSLGGLNTAISIDISAAGVDQKIAGAVAAHKAAIDAQAAACWNDPRYVAVRDGGGPPTPPPPSLPAALPPPQQSATEVAQTMADTIHQAVAAVPDGADVQQLRDALTSALAPYLPHGG